MGQARDRIGELDVDQILPLIDRSTKTHMYFEGHKIHLHSLRLQTFKHKGCVCVRCGLLGTKFVVERDKFHLKQLNTGPFHINLYGVTVHGNERLFTKDHIFPKSRGGRDELSNMQTMCENCNRKKGADREFELVNLMWTDTLPPYNVRDHL